MSKILNPFEFQQGDSPLLMSMPHSGVMLLDEIEHQLTEEAKALPDTDWYIPELYDFLQHSSVSIIRANYSRYVVDLNRPIDDRPLYASKTTGLFPQVLFSERPVFCGNDGHSELLKTQIKQDIWQPYHQKISAELARIKAKFGYAILFDAHSIAAHVPMLFEGKLSDFNFGNNDGIASASVLLEGLGKIVQQTDYSHVCNGRFKGGYITRMYGAPDQNIHAIQLELSQATYLEDCTPDYQLAVDKKQRISALLQQLISYLLKETVINPQTPLTS